MAIPPQFLKGKQKQDTAAQDAKETPAQHAKDLASGKDKPGPGDKGFKTKSNKGNKNSNAKRAALLAQLRGGK